MVLTINIYIYKYTCMHCFKTVMNGEIVSSQKKLFGPSPCSRMICLEN